MRRTYLLPLLVAPLFAGGDSVEVVDEWVERYASRRSTLAGADLERLDRSLIDLRGYSRRSPVHSGQAARALLDLCAACLAATESPARRREAWTLRDRAADEWERLPGSGLDWAVREVLVVGAGNPPERRIAAAHLLTTHVEPNVLRGLVVAVRDTNPRVAAAAADALVGRTDVSVHRAFVAGLEAAPPPAWVAAAEAHFRTVRLEDDALQERLAALALARLESSGRRGVAAGAALSGALRDELAVPALLDALERWGESEDEDPRRERARNDIVRALERRAGLRLGPHPERWRTWWRAQREGSPLEPVGEEDRTRSGFFGIRPDSSRVVFVLDRSGSMQLPFEGSLDPPRSRYEVALEQVSAYLEALGPEARFNVVLFEDGFEAWRADLQSASSAGVRAACTWARRRPPSGGTQLRHGLERAFEVQPNGSPHPEGPAADTVIVLCDGRTDEGSGWVRPFLRRVNPAARVVIHAVQIGEAGDGTLETLARETGGEFVGPKSARAGR